MAAAIAALPPAMWTGPLARLARPSAATSAGSLTIMPGTSKLRPTRSIAGVLVTPSTSSTTSTLCSRSSSHRLSAKIRENALAPPYTECRSAPM